MQMNPKVQAVVHMVMAFVIMAILSVVVYFVGCEAMAKGILAEAQTAGAVDIPKLIDWKEEHYYYLVQDVGVLAGLILMLWSALTHFVPSLGKRAVWVVLGVIVIALCVVMPHVIHELDPQMLYDMKIPALFVVCYFFVGYWFGSIFLSSNWCKYVPPLARFFR